MISEVENLEGKTLELKSELKAFGGSTANITPGPDGIAPLSKQNSFKKEEVIESLDLNTPEPEPTPISVADPSSLEGFKMPEINIPMLDEQPVTEELPQAKDIQMPEMPSEVLAQEPQGVNEGLFSNAAATPEAVQEPTPTPAPVETPVPVEPVVEEVIDAPVLVNPLLGETPTVAPTLEEPTPTPAPEAPVEAAPEVPAPVETPTPAVEEPVPAPVEEPKAEEPAPAGTSIFETMDAEENTKNSEFNKEELEKYVTNLIEEYNKDLKEKFGEVLNTASKDIMTKLVDIPVFLTEKVSERAENKDIVAEEPKEEVPAVENKPEELAAVPTMDEPIMPNLEPVTMSEPEVAPAPIEPSEAPKEVIEELPTLEAALETVPALEAVQTELEPAPEVVPEPAPVEAAPVVEEPVQDQSSVFPPASHDNLVEDAFTQINNMQIPSGLDNTQIQGKFL